MDYETNNLLENGICFISQSINHLHNAEKIRDEERDESINRELKYSILHLHAGISIILKEKLAREHWALLFQNIDKASLKDFRSGNFTGISFDKCIDRLKEISSLGIRKEEKSILKQLKIKRNKIEHFCNEDSLDSFKPIIFKAINFFMNFIDEKTLEYLKENDAFVEVRKSLSALEEFVRFKMNEISSEKLENILTCPECFLDFFIKDSNELVIQCLFCLYKLNEGDDFSSCYEVNSAYDDPRDPSPSYYCSSCDEEDYIVFYKGSRSYICLSCLESSDEINDCSRCGVHYVNGVDSIYADTDICENCFSYIMSKDD